MDNSTVIITGASMGFGYTLCREIDKQFNNVHFILISRSEDKLIELSTHLRNSFTIIVQDLTLLNNTDYNPSIKHQTVYLFNNAASLGNLKPIDEYTVDELRTYFDLNIISALQISSWLIKINVDKKHIINISSLAASKAFASWGVYCMGKAARKMFHEIISCEYPNIRVLNYSPGPLDTDMQKQIRESGCESVSKYFTQLQIEGKLVPIMDSVKKLINTLASNTYSNADSIDFYD